LDSRYDDQIPEANRFDVDMFFLSMTAARVSIFVKSKSPIAISPLQRKFEKK
jgi:hypothetical protein